MIGITAYGVCLPYYRIKRRTIFEAMGWFNPGLAGIAAGEKTVANHDEDSLTLAVGAGMDCCREVDRGEITSFLLASTSLPYTERSGSAIAALAMNLPDATRTADFSGALKAGTTALISALTDSDPGLKLVAAADCRLGKAGGSQEGLFGDAAVAFTVGSGDVIASFEGHHSLSADFSDNRRLQGDQFVRPWEERWVRQEGYLKFIPQTIGGLLGKIGLEIKDVAKVVFPPLSARDHAALARTMGLEKGQVQDPLVQEVGNAGSAHPLLMLASALEEAQPGDRIVLASYGSGSDALLFQVTEAAAGYRNRNKVRQNLTYKQEMDSYPKYLSFKGMLDKEVGIRGEEIAVTSLSLTWRERDTVLRLAGSKCLACGTPQFPGERMCINPSCGAVDQMEDYTFADKPAHLFTFTADHLAYSEDPPNLYGIVDFDGGGRYWFDLTDCRLDQLAIGQPVQMSFRRKYQDKARSLCGYFWKAMPLKE